MKLNALAAVLLLLGLTLNVYLFHGGKYGRERPNIIYRKSLKTCSTSWMVWLRENLHPEYCIVSSEQSGHAIEGARRQLGMCCKDRPIAVIDNNDILRSDLEEINGRRTVIFDSIRDPVTRIVSLCKKMSPEKMYLKGNEYCLSASSEIFRKYKYPPDGEENEDNRIDFYVDCEEIENSICRMMSFFPQSLKKVVTRMKTINYQAKNLSISLTSKSVDNFREVSDEYLESKFNSVLVDEKKKKCEISYRSSNLAEHMYDEYGRVNF